LSGLASWTPVDVASHDPELQGTLERAWSRCVGPTADSSAVITDPVPVRLLGPAERADTDLGGVQTVNPEILLQRLTQEVTYAKIRAQAGKLYMFHAGAVANVDTGDAVAFVAPGGTGKTTLIRSLGSRYGYLTDETVGVDVSRRIYPYPKPLSTRGEKGAPKAEISPDDLGLLPAPEAPVLRRVVLLNRDQHHHGRPTIQPLDTVQAIMALAPESSSLSLLPRPLHTLAGILDSLDHTVRLTYREVASLDALVDDWLTRP